MLLIAIDGACRRNGKPDCTSAGGVFIQRFNEEGVPVHFEQLSVHEYNSTNQRGELLALLEALRRLDGVREEAQILTDSEYLFNAMSKDWLSRWSTNGWSTAAGEDVKNADIWVQILDAVQRVPFEIAYYHIKGHVIPFGKVTAQRSLQYDPTGRDLALQAADQFERKASSRETAFAYASELSRKNNGFPLPMNILKRFVVANVVADAVATNAVEATDRIL